MTREETAQILAILKATFPNSYKNMTPEEARGTITVWATQFHNIPVDVVLLALHKAISTAIYPPTIADIKDKFRSLYIESKLIYNDVRAGRVELSREELEKIVQIIGILNDYSYSKKTEIPLIDLLKLTTPQTSENPALSEKPKKPLIDLAAIPVIDEKSKGGK